MSRIPLAAFFVASALFVAADDPPAGAPSAGSAAKEPDRNRRKVGLEVEIERLGQVDRLTVYVYNEQDEPLEFENGAAGGPGSLDDRDESVYGTDPTVLPELSFSTKAVEGGRPGPRTISLRPPAFSGPTRRSMRPHKVVVPPHHRFLYASFLVPHEYTQGEFGGAYLRLPRKPGAGEWLLHGSTLTEKSAEEPKE